MKDVLKLKGDDFSLSSFVTKTFEISGFNATVPRTRKEVESKDD